MRVSIGEWLLHSFGTGQFGGVTFGGWLRMLAHNGFRVFPSCWGKAATITAVSLANSAAARIETLRYGRAWRRQKIEAPLFVIGHYRSGTTHLHNLLAVDDRFASPTLLECSNPSTFLSMGPLIEKIGNVLPSRRPMDGVRQHIRVPSEDELAVGMLSGYSPYFGMSFPRHGDRYDRFITFKECRPYQVRRWQRCMKYFLKKVTLQYGKPLILKSPPHTARIRMILELFPDARFVHIHRDPFRVFQSTLHLYRSLMPWVRLQRWSENDLATLEDRVIRNYRALYDAYLEQRDLIPEGHFHEVRYDQLESDPVGVVREIYDTLSLPDFDSVEPNLTRYVETLSGYRKNRFPDLRPELRERIVEAWRPFFELWDYPTGIEPETDATPSSLTTGSRVGNARSESPDRGEAARTKTPLMAPVTSSQKHVYAQSGNEGVTADLDRTTTSGS